MKTVTFVKLHGPTFVPGVGAIGDTLTSNGTTSKTIALKMYEEDHQIAIQWGSKIFKIPKSNVQIYEVAKEEQLAQVLPHVKKTNSST